VRPSFSPTGVVPAVVETKVGNLGGLEGWLPLPLEVRIALPSGEQNTKSEHHCQRSITQGFGWQMLPRQAVPQAAQGVTRWPIWSNPPQLLLRGAGRTSVRRLSAQMRPSWPD
jgi:hypothetical protein